MPCFYLKNFFLEPFGFFSSIIIESFGLLLTMLVALEILKNITGHLRKNVFQVELVIVTSFIAVARKIIILDFEKRSGIDLIGLAIAIFVSISYWIVRSTNTTEPN